MDSIRRKQLFARSKCLVTNLKLILHLAADGSVDSATQYSHYEAAVFFRRKNNVNT